MNETNTCLNCRTKFKGGLMSSVKPFTEGQTAIINEYCENKSAEYCTKCGKTLYEKYITELRNERSNLSNYLRKNINNILVISTHSPLNWDYKVLGMVTGQSTTGTGFITEFTSSFTDLFGAQSDRHNNKLKAGENLCFAQLRAQTLNLGGNAIIATDIDYSEIGAAKGMLMVCMSGTAIKLNNTNILEKEKIEIIDKLIYANDRLIFLKKYN